jgi:hypothetical protein
MLTFGSVLSIFMQLFCKYEFLLKFEKVVTILQLKQERSKQLKYITVCEQVERQ